jgi:predicted DNA-binding transcriptional regulator AlpA
MHASDDDIQKPFYSMTDVMKITGRSRVTIYRWEEDGQFPKRLDMGEGTLLWSLGDVDSWAVNPKAVICGNGVTN